MHRFSTRLALLAALAAVACAAATATPAVAGPAPSAAEAPCWNGGPTAFDVNWDSGNTLRGAEREPVAWKDPAIGDAPDVVRKAATIPVYFHVFTDGAIGNLTNHQLQNQVNVLNTGLGGFEGGVATASASSSQESSASTTRTGSTTSPTARPSRVRPKRPRMSVTPAR
jgi:hypothetical protein